MQVFLVRKSAALQRKVLSVRLREDQSGTPICHFAVRESQYSKSHVCFNRLYLDCWDGWGYLYQYIIIYSQITNQQSQITDLKKNKPMHRRGPSVWSNQVWVCVSMWCSVELFFQSNGVINCRHKAIKYWSEREVVAVTPYLLSVFSSSERFADKALTLSKRLAKCDLHSVRPHDHIFIYTASGVTLTCEHAEARCAYEWL